MAHSGPNRRASPEAAPLELAALDAQIPIVAGEVHLWFCPDYESIENARTLAAFEALLTEDERRRGDGFALDEVRHQHVITRALVRTSLSRYAAIPPEAWRFGENERGRPFIAGPAHAPRLHFNLSHTAGLVVLAVNRVCEEIGVDAEDCTRPVDILAMADRNFSPSEVLALRELPAAEQLQRFFAYWTLKEAYLKARGVGLSAALDQVTLELGPRTPVRARFGPELPDDSERWSFALLELGDRHLVALAIACGVGAAPAIRWAFGLGSERRDLNLCFPLRPG